MIPARARNASFASPELGNAAATSGSRTTTALPAAYRDAYLLREARLKSYSGRISSASTWLTTSLLLSDFFMVPSFTAGCRPRADDANRAAPLSIHDRETKRHFQFAATRPYMADPVELDDTIFSRQHPMSSLAENTRLKTPLYTPPTPRGPVWQMPVATPQRGHPRVGAEGFSGSGAPNWVLCQRLFPKLLMGCCR